MGPSLIVFLKSSVHHSNSRHKNDCMCQKYSKRIILLWTYHTILSNLSNFGKWCLHTVFTCFLLSNYVHNNLWFANLNTSVMSFYMVISEQINCLQSAESGACKWRNDENKMRQPWKRFLSGYHIWLIFKWNYVNFNYGDVSVNHLPGSGGENGGKVCNSDFT